MSRDQDHLIIPNHHGSVQLRVVIHVHLWLKTFLHLEKLERIIWFSFFKGTAKNWSDYWSWDDLELNKGLKKRSDILDMMQKKCSEPVLADLVDSEKMTESRFIIPQDIPSPN
ncbi:hypothetical protein NC653_001627 [Populus alba x Populus x berolinensis]|uniref:Uncharacterized protein n=1 Tax=Populus alba x Populus x berolinensis TaxID=444605 RepID=A0AAD6WG90_9ROSI|nr:hypothetical protein NC653_001627 [Populus alba x Populus x berolinensis]